MASLRIFVSSTCYDLAPIRGQIRSFISSMGYEPIMSDYNDILYDPRIHTHTSCIEEIATCDLILLIVGSRFGGRAIPEAISKIDFDALIDKSKSVDHLKKKDNISVTQLEVLKAVEIEIPIFTFIDNRLWNDHELYEKNKSKTILKDIEFPSIDKPETAEFIFEFINFLRHRTRGNSINTFGKFEDIEQALKKQWAGLFQRLLNETRNKQLETKRIDILTNQFEDLKTAILTSIGNTNEREVARSVVRFRRLIDILRSFKLSSYSQILNGNITWETFLREIVGVKDIINAEPFNTSGGQVMRLRTFLIKSDNTFYESRFNPDYIINELGPEFDAFTMLSTEVKHIVFDALNEMRGQMMPMIRYVNQDYREYLERNSKERRTTTPLFENEDTPTEN
ncbi:DUF4062 domain-containing protein [Mucilaginibacter sp. RS28]|uniref:DUF4062 domain-containing protein n=1 Tax=Mucilaginibacter straminoryzae TaxID=2932774 RepID=A0A9X2BD60_9SPHI|nr:DUF4062 domain-containing protein [Mucilaginibacter straminoryzae]MCJ8209943.1 DUF4062 domain-containing protein [Mucilaginibacter straminoryzae]